jgi:hypothetical protein
MRTFKGEYAQFSFNKCPIHSATEKPATVGTPTIVLSSAGMPTACRDARKSMEANTHEFSWNSANISSVRQKNVKEDKTRAKIYIFV